MKINKILGVDIDVLGTWASLVCAVHCAATPIVISYGVLSGISIFENEVWDITLIVISAILASLSLFSGYNNKHHDFTPLGLAILGFAVFAIGHLVLKSSMGHIVTAFGGVFIALAHIKNAALLKSCPKR